MKAATNVLGNKCGVKIVNRRKGKIMLLRDVFDGPRFGVIRSFAIYKNDDDRNLIKLFEKIANEGDMFDGVVSSQIPAELLDEEVLYIYAEEENGEPVLVIEVNSDYYL